MSHLLRTVGNATYLFRLTSPVLTFSSPPHIGGCHGLPIRPHRVRAIEVTEAERGPLEPATGDLGAWLEGVAGQPVRVGPPVDGPEDTGATLWPYELRSQRQTTGTGSRHPYRFTVRYVVTG